MSSVFDSLIPATEEARLQALHRYQILNASNEQLLDDIVALTARLLQVPSALISLVDEKEVVFKSNYGIGGDRVPRNQSMCSVAVLQDGITVYENLTEETSALVDPTVVRQLNMQFYAGHSLNTPEGHNIGTLCVLDYQPRPFTAPERALLGTMAGVVMRLLELRLVLARKQQTSFRFWDPVYKAIGDQLSRLNRFADEAPARTDAPYTLAPAINKEATAMAETIDQFIAATLKRV
ncbi:GAF domain-containing protein [Hymenobacter sp. BT175]|uniref:GAF domain-containing protein n=1 Tax=Hymenobacter translucens TaxID=2886507 RepID=UPI001D0E9BAA|nr:GAF domain-containing protein [Hymenobacter translucens]MCC2545402.1 GAF domain-containing protein [Hymenobacter translucens]